MATTEQSVSVASNPSHGSAQDITPGSPSPSIWPKDRGESLMHNIIHLFHKRIA